MRTTANKKAKEFLKRARKSSKLDKEKQLELEELKKFQARFSKRIKRSAIMGKRLSKLQDSLACILPHENHELSSQYRLEPHSDLSKISKPNAIQKGEQPEAKFMNKVLKRKGHKKPNFVYIKY